VSQLDSIGDIKRNHQKLYDKALKDIPDFLREVSESSSTGIRRNVEELLRNSKNFKYYLDEVESLIEQIQSASAQTTSFDDYNWLRDAAIKWQTVYAGTLNIPKTIQVSLPSEDMELPSLVLPSLPAGRALTEREIEGLLRLLADHTFLCRTIQLSVVEDRETERANDRYLAEVAFVADVIEGPANFPSRIGRSSYWRLEKMWLKAIKEYSAYLYTLTKWHDLRGSHPARDRQDYDEICKHLRELILTQKKGQKIEFEEPKSYIEERYLTDGKLDLRKPEARKLVEKKAERFSEKARESGFIADDFINWLDAETYTKMFYENIIPAVLETDPKIAKEKILTVLKALQFSETAKNRYHVVNCFEVALAIYFLNARIVQDLWDEFANQPPPDSCVESVVDVKSWPETFQIPENCEGVFFPFAQKISFRGVMTEEQKKALLDKSKDEQLGKPIEDLFTKSRTVHRETTL
jgi:hypothetical protein